MTKLTCKFFGHQWKNEAGGECILTWNGHSRCYRCGYEEDRGMDPASWFDYPGGDTDSWGSLNVDKIPDDAKLTLRDS